VTGQLDLDRYGSVLFDLDGTIYLDREPLPGAPEFVSSCRRRGARVGFITNMTWQEKSWCLEGLRAAGIQARPEELFTAADAVAHAIRAVGIRRVAFLGGDGLRAALERRGIHAEAITESTPSDWPSPSFARSAVAIGMFPGIEEEDLRATATLIERGSPAYVSSVDSGVPTRNGVLPGAAAVLAALERLVDFTPVVCGKPAAPFAELVYRYVEGAGPTLVVGDSREADVALAARHGWDSLLVLTGMAQEADIAGADPRPTYVAKDLSTALRRGSRQV